MTAFDGEPLPRTGIGRGVARHETVSAAL